MRRGFSCAIFVGALFVALACTSQPAPRSSSEGEAGRAAAGETSAAAGQSGAVAAGGNAQGGNTQTGTGGHAGVESTAGQGGAQVSSAGATGSGGASPAGPRFIGRFDRSNASAPVFAWSGTAIALRFRGSAIAVTLTDSGNNWFEVVVDDQHSVLAAQAGTKKYSLASGLSDGPHDVLVYRRSEAFNGETTFNGFDVPTSAYLPGPTPPTRRLEVIGDSISAGYGNEGTLPCPFEPKTENHYLTYGAIAARAVNAELYTEAWSGIGMVRNNAGDTVGTMPVRYPRALPDRATSTWDFSAYVPDAVLINLGTNDFSKGDPTSAFQSTYSQFVSDLRAHYPKARFYLALGPMLGGADYDQAKAYLNAVIAARASAGDTNLTLQLFDPQNAQVDGLGCDYHPSLATHQKMAARWVASLKADLGW